MSKYSISPIDHVKDFSEHLQIEFKNYCNEFNFKVRNSKGKILKKPTHYNITDLKIKWVLKIISKLLNEIEPNFQKNKSFGSSPMKKEYWINCGCSENIAKYKVKSQRKLNAEYWLLRGFNPKSGIFKFQSQNGKKADSSKRLVPTQFKYWMINKNMSETESKNKVSSIQSRFSLEKCIGKYGKEKGEIIFNKRQKKWKESLHKNFEKYGDGRSFQSKSASDIIKIICKELGLKIPKKEKYIKNGSQAYAYDFCLKEKRKIIEFHGNYWHCNPKFYEKDYYNSSIGMTAEEKWNFDKKKLDLARNHGYDVLVIWEDEWQESLIETAKIALNFIKR